ncbi:CAP domain-containing protein [Paenibacillus sp. N3/727]|uniref:CAP domain-containing protein n=1 Tax=Paenibacillus sp. N3/727 TaxID=2925845 RepID=UPI001F538A00|nr:CAP domain-containing protein [Paenibacillus sp. N3/727]UNK20608.1 CAP domain-containing protein [Paenibacillus sp. N3/727]
MKKPMIKKIVSTGFVAVLSVGIMLPASASAATPTESAQSWQQKIQQLLESQGWGGNLNCVVQKPDFKPQPEKPSTPAVEKPSTSTPSTSKPAELAQPSKPSTPANTTDKSNFASQVVTLVNKERAKAGLKALTVNEKLTGMAVDKAKDMNNNNYFDHTSPTYGSPLDMMKQYGISYSYAGENIAKGQRTPEEVMNSWMNSEGHRKNIMSPNFTMIGVGYYNGYWVQEFISQK